ncbi:hypothetical protein SmaMPs15_000262 [Stenotrophomonas maltophilia phage vB_SmaM_Ps15]|uniref:Uncharacterized protein n=1 Tax=Stenotrophomonas maltophilia phage vB_SmaM_Ps15 TaxID=3071007 RepID=A0AAE9FPM4_9CAUD|nr:hypothetical protein PQC01_gp216 [Stenotrophomonas maltophilia phage vB_SmaM_Ps15]QXN67270.1 hypothetical protein [Stenotrophomonas phage BUCT608]QYC97407.1 hypothetical protein [Stenotrophomonas phage BUCT608]UMO77413.1 hypothetical protein SmaMPs15_000262 [Stenotrophomonas maltophilia phage vB_SmaM_Ps15]
MASTLEPNLERYIMKKSKKQALKSDKKQQIRNARRDKQLARAVGIR